MNEHMISMATTSETSVNLNALSLQKKLEITDKMNATSYVPHKKSLQNMPFVSTLRLYKITKKYLDSL